MPKMKENRMIMFLLGPVLALLFLLSSAAYSDEKPVKLTGKEVFEQNCLKCHKPEKFTSQHHNRREWEQILSRMELNTCVLTDSEATAVADYLVKVHGD